MAIYIKGMEMPKTCWDCPMMYDYLYCVVTMDKRVKEDARADSCPLTEIPEPHGRLIDADTVGWAKHVPDVGYLTQYQQGWNNGVDYMMGEIDDAPTVIEGSE